MMWADAIIMVQSASTYCYRLIHVLLVTNFQLQVDLQVEFVSNDMYIVGETVQPLNIQYDYNINKNVPV